MTDAHLLQQADAITSILPKLMRQFAVLDDDDPAMELPLAQLRVCSILRDGSRTMTALSKELGISLSAITQIADRLERSDMVERVSGTDDRRSRSLRLTPQGMEIMRRRREKRIQRVAQVLGSLPLGEREAVISALQMLLEASHGAETEGLGTPRLVEA